MNRLNGKTAVITGWAEDLKGTGIRVNVLSPGATAAWRNSDALRPN